jgi:large subunit ribosomal protein L25
MADQIALTAEARPGDGKGEARALRHEGRVPAVAYGSGLDSTPVHVDARELRYALNTEAGENAVIKLQIADDTHLAMARQIHRHPVRRDVLHLDFVTINRNQAVVVDVPIHVLGEIDGAIISQPLNSLSIEVLPLEVPDSFEVSVEGLEVGDVIRVSDVVIPDGVTVLNEADETVVSITVPSEEPAEDDDTAPEGGETEAVESGDEPEDGDGGDA